MSHNELKNAKILYGFSDIDILSPKEITKRYHKLISKYHPDKFQGDDGDISKKINAYRDILMKEYHRKNNKKKNVNLFEDNFDSHFQKIYEMDPDDIGFEDLDNVHQSFLGDRFGSGMTMNPFFGINDMLKGSLFGNFGSNDLLRKTITRDSKVPDFSKPQVFSYSSSQVYKNDPIDPNKYMSTKKDSYYINDGKHKPIHKERIIYKDPRGERVTYPKLQLKDKNVTKRFLQ